MKNGLLIKCDILGQTKYVLRIYSTNELGSNGTIFYDVNLKEKQYEEMSKLDIEILEIS